MAEAEKQQKLVKLYTMIASGMAAMVAALFTSKLGVAGTLIGAALTAMTINLGSAVLSASWRKSLHQGHHPADQRARPSLYPEGSHPRQGEPRARPGAVYEVY